MAPLGEQGVALLAEQLAAAVRAGLGAGRAWQVLAGRQGPQALVCRAVAAHLAAGGTPAEALRLLSGGGGPLCWLSVVCDVAERAGAPLADVLDGFSMALRAEVAAGEEIAAALAGPRATAALLSGLPLAGLGLGALLGVNPLRTLVGTPAGRVCLLAGIALWSAGRWRTGRLVSRAAGGAGWRS